MQKNVLVRRSKSNAHRTPGKGCVTMTQNAKKRDAKNRPHFPNISSYENTIASNFFSMIGNNMGYQKVLNI